MEKKHFNSSKNIRIRSSNGVTIIELIVFLAVFSVILVAVVSIFLSVIRQQKGVLRDHEILNQINYSMEYMSRTIKTAINDENGTCLVGFAGYDYLLTHFDSSSGFYQGIKFISDDYICREFFLDVDGSLKETKSGSTQTILSSSSFNEFTIEYVRFIINGDKNLSSVSPTSPIQPRITFLLDILTPIESGNQKEKVFQTTISRRNLSRF